LTRDRAKPAVPFGGSYRIIDFTLSNCLNSGLRQMLVMTQYKAMSLDRHVNLGWRFLCRELGEFVDIVPPQQRIDENWYQGTADAVYQNIYTLEKYRPELVLILAGDHIYKMDYAKMIDFHRQSGAELTISALPVSIEEAKGFGVMEVDREQRVRGFQEKDPAPKTIPGDPTRCLASMGIYVFNARFLFEQLCQDANRQGSQHDFGKNIIPSIIDTHRVFAYPFRDENLEQGKPKDAYWRDVGTIDAYYEANMDLISVHPVLNVYDERWPLRTYMPCLPPAKFVFQDQDRRGRALDSIVCHGSILSGGTVRGSVVGVNVRVNSYSQVEDSILFDNVNIGRYAKIRKAIIDKGVHVPPGMEIGYDLQLDAARGFKISESGVVVIAKGEHLEHFALPLAAGRT